MAYDMRTHACNRDLTSAETGMLKDVYQIESALATGHCFAGLNFMQRAATRIAIFFAAKVCSGCIPEVQLSEDGYHVLYNQPPVTETAESSTPVAELIERSYQRDHRSQLARLALRRRPPEADDRYFATHDEDDDSAEISPELARFRERVSFRLQSV